MTLETQSIALWVKALLLRLTPVQRRRLNRQVGITVRRSQAQRIAAQRNPDGSAFAPRKKKASKGMSTPSKRKSIPKKKLRQRKGRIKQALMFKKLRTARHFKIDAHANALAVGFKGRNAMIASRHQYGLTEKKSNGQIIRTPKRELLGLTDHDWQKIEAQYVNYLALEK